VDAPGGDLDHFGLCRISKNQHMLERFPFMRARRSRWLPFGPRWTEKERLRIYHALAPFRELGELDGACAVILTASQRRRGRAPSALERLLVGLRYLEAAERSAVYRDPPAWLERVGRLTAAAARCARAGPRLRVAAAAKAERPPVRAPSESMPESKAA
jgi:hypothetical protein